MNINTLYKIYRDHPDISTDSRSIRQGCLFFALKGEKFNGNAFVGDAIKKGAYIAIADKKDCPAGEKIITVDDVLLTLQQLATYHRRACRFRILAITGSNGKTTTKELCSSVLRLKHKVFATGGNLNNHIGVPLTLLSMKPDTEIGIVEMGANHPQEITQLCNIAQPDYGLITNIGKAHLEGFGSIEGVARAKGELFSYLSLHKGTIFANAGDDRICGLIPDASKNVVLYNSRGTIRAEVRKSDLFLVLDVHDKGDIITLKSKLVGKYNTENILAAYVVGKYFGITAQKIGKAIEAYTPANNRSQYIRTARHEIILDAYNANPTSMIQALENFFAIKRTDSLIILGEMLELGESSSREHQAVIERLKKEPVKHVICVGQNFKTPAKSAGYNWYPDVGSLQSDLERSPLKASFILIKGSRGNKLEKLMEVL
ncbi:MAG: UDP-N-acetylmuramoyl-tripeptide--D-alanyl-D-alanine ligase [Bacteroidales bacterium]|nr:UDP-N-acetylmuramoyl-tripeptide--D-alanyl-D-alanine ligase [Bacteroidales bacterium]MBN2764555.1 UDP-N-acetylmuramoyl-tripeptide--D-alanyl-D-alanine ligase [Bacteroidales bacterium]